MKFKLDKGYYVPYDDHKYVQPEDFDEDGSL